MARFADPNKYARVKPPKSISDVPRYLGELLGGFFKRFFYIARLVWESGKWIMVLLSFMAIFKGVTPVIGSLISKSILNELQEIVKSGSLPGEEFLSSPVCFLIVFFFVFRLHRAAKEYPQLTVTLSEAEPRRGDACVGVSPGAEKRNHRLTSPRRRDPFDCAPRCSAPLRVTVI